MFAGLSKVLAAWSRPVASGNDRLPHPATPALHARIRLATAYSLMFPRPLYQFAHGCRYAPSSAFPVQVVRRLSLSTPVPVARL
jgi:hypothetical protein